MRLLSVMFIVFSALSVGSSAYALDHGDSDNSRSTITDSRTLDDVESFLKDPQTFLEREKSAFLEKIRQDDPERADKTQAIFKEYEQKLKDIRAKVSADSLQDAYDKSQIRKELEKLETDLRVLFPKGVNLNKILNGLKDRNWELSDEEWDSIFDRLGKDESDRMHKITSELRNASKELRRLKEEARGKTLSELGQEKINEMRDRARGIQHLESDFQREFNTLKTDFQELAQYHLDRAQIGVDHLKEEFEKEKRNLDQELEKGKQKANEIKSRIDELFR